MSEYWWRAYDGAVDHPKLCLLSDRAHRGWFNLLCVAAANDGVLPAMEVLTVKLRLPRKKIEAIIAELVNRALLDEVDGTLRPHNWDRRQFKSDVTDPTAAQRMQRYRNRHRNADRNERNDPVTVTPPILQTTETDTEAERKKGKGPTRKRAATTPKVELPENWLPSEDLTAAENGELERMRDWARANAIRRADWLATWRNWKRRALEFQQQRARTNGHHRKQSGTELAYELAAEVREREHSAGIRRSDDPVGSH